jgi:phage terminase large subunit GpA-like protein
MNYQFANAEELAKSVLAAFKPPPDITLSEWADKYRKLSPESSASPGKFDTSRTEYFREPMDMIGEPGVKSVSLMTSAQVGKSTLIENIIGYFIHLDPCPILHISPTLDSQKMFSKERLAPMIRDTPVLSKLVRPSRSRDSGNTLASKTFPGGHIAMVGSNSPSGLASRPIRILLADEVDRFERSAGTEGDPLKLGVKRTTTYWNRVLAYVSTPGDKYNPQTKTGSRIEKEFLAGDQRYRHCPCPDCGEEQPLKWSQVHWEEGDPESAVYTCEHCGSCWDDNMRNEAVKQGRWIASKPFNGRVSYHLSQLYSPFARLADGVAEFLDSKSDPQLLKTWVNTFLGETWEDRGERLEWSNLKDQREEYDSFENIPEEITVITAAVDVQDDRLEYEFVGWGDDFRSWSLHYGQVYGDLSAPEPWEEMQELLGVTFTHPIFGEMAIRNICIDSGGHYTEKVYKFSQLSTKFQAIKGMDGQGRPFVGRPLKNTIGNARVFPLGVYSIKETVVARLRNGDPDKPGYCYFPMHYDDEYFKMLTAEELKTKFSRGFKKQEWVKIRRRNEAFDLRVYNTAALDMLSINLNAERRRLKQKYMQKKETDATKKRASVRKKSNWADGWR